MEERVIATNRKLYRDFEVLETFECGIELKGSEVKSLREAKANIDDAFGRIETGEVYLYNCHITPYEKASYFKEEATRPRRLLLHKNQIRRLTGQVSQRGFTLAPLKLYFNTRGLVKVAMSLVRGKKLYDRREDIKRREMERDMRRAARRK
ncbi:SsrA-binding protein [Candidatus Velamenicoccus archaeovorus]|uniref:SsrA-binding protein n=1 Tax=Velamenicoccus archaeovorus TaxID=1930593 RepID=A0A410P2Y4_VELA1|nr:SsrA-binding protein SmpB [Candidatus Velamenicoccus archaeovorus]QAT16480.1 SsrA-binding protein [Candidatus Velamenicoccus archaeovorus]